MKQVLFLLLSISLLLSFQNCGDLHAPVLHRSLDPFSGILLKKADYYYNLRLLEMESENGLSRFKILLVLASAKDPNFEIDYQLQITDQNNQYLCPTDEAKVTRNNNYSEYECFAKRDSDRLVIALKVREPGQDQYSTIAIQKYSR